MSLEKTALIKIYLPFIVIISVIAVLGYMLKAGKNNSPAVASPIITSPVVASPVVTIPIITNFISPTPITTPANSEAPIDFYSCKLDSDCIFVKADCCGCSAGGTATAINKSFISQWKNNCDRENVSCVTVMSTDPSCINKIPQCVSNKCVLK